MEKFHKLWTKAAYSDLYMWDDKKKWQSLERELQTAIKNNERKNIDYWLQISELFCEECCGGTSWPDGKPWILR